MIGSQLFKLFFKPATNLKQINKLAINSLFQAPKSLFSSEGVKKVQEELQGSNTPFEISSARQMMIADRKIVKGEIIKRPYNAPKVSKRRSDMQQYNETDKSSKGRKGENKLPKSLTQEEMMDLLPQLNQVRNYYQVLDQFTEQNFLDVVMNEKIINDPNYALALNNLWTYSRKFRLMNTYKTPQFEQITKTISENLDNLQVPENISGFSFNLYKVNYEGVEPYIQIEKYVLEHMEKYPLKALAQIAYSFSKISRSQTTHDFSHFYGKMQLVLALKLRDAIVDAQTDIKQLQKDYTQIITGYSKSQNLSKEFLYVLEQFIINHISYFEPREKTSTLYTFAVNNYFSKPLCETCIADFTKSFESFNLQEMSHLLVSLDKFDMLDEEIMKIVKEQFLLRKSQINLLDLADICSVFFKREFVDEELFNVVRETYKALRQNTDIFVVSKLLTNVSTLLNKELMPHRFFKVLIQSLQIVSNDKDLKGRLVDELKADGQKILHPQFKEQYLDTLNNLRKVDYKTMKAEIKEKTQDKKDARVKKHFQILNKEKQRDERAMGKKESYSHSDRDRKPYHKDHKDHKGEKQWRQAKPTEDQE